MPGKSTHAIHGSRRDKAYRSVNFPIYNSVSFAVDKSDDYQHFIDQDEETFIYARNGNPTIRAVEEKLAVLEQGSDAVLLASGMAAITTTILSLVKSGDAAACSRRVYGTAYRFFRDVLPQYGVDVHLLDDDELLNLHEFAPTVKLVYFETPINPTAECVEIASIVAAAKQVGATTVIDNTFASPINQNPLVHGVNLVVHSATKYLGGHSDIMAGVVVGNDSQIQAVRRNMVMLGGCSNAGDAAQLDRSLKTLRVRVEAQNRSALSIAQFFQGEGKTVYYPGLPESESYAIAQAQMSGFGGMLSVDLGSFEAAKRFCDRLQVALNASSLGSVETLVSIPVLTSHLRLGEDELKAAHVTPGMVRISAGLEEVEDLIADFKQAL